MASSLPGRSSLLSLLMVSAVVAPLMLPDGLSGCLILAALVCVSWCLHLGLRDRTGLDRSRIVTAAFALIGVAILSFLVGQYPWFPVPHAPMRAQIGGLALFVLSAGLFLAVGHEVRSLAVLRRLTWLFLAGGGLMVLLQLIPALPIAGSLDAVTHPETIGSAFWTWIVAMSAAQALHNVRLTPSLRIPVLLIGLAALARGLWTFTWVSGWLPPLVALAVVVFLRFPRFTLGATMLSAVPVLMASGSISAVLWKDEAYSWSSRVEAWGLVLRILETNPWLGFGPANYYHYTALFPIWGWWVRFNSHNNYLDLLAQTGVIGLLVFGWFAIEAMLLAVKLWRWLPDGFARGYAAGSLGGLAGMLVAGVLADWIIPFTYNIGLRGFRSSLLFWFFLGGLVSLRRMLLQPDSPLIDDRLVPARA
jgi:O-antigen ligase